MKLVKVAIDRHGNVDIDVLGTRGSQCEEIVVPLIEQLGSIESEEKKDSYYHHEHIRSAQQTEIDTGWGGD